MAAPEELDGHRQTEIEGVRFKQTFDSPDTPTRKAHQYYELIGSRAIWSDGWKAVCEQPQEVEVLTEELLKTKKWELYHVDEDFSESTDLADTHPEKLQELIDLWWVAAGQYNVLPLDSRMQSRFKAEKPSTIGDRNEFIYRPNSSQVFDHSAVKVLNRSHKIVARCIDLDPSHEGILLAHGGKFCGYSLFIKDRKLIFAHNYLAAEVYHVVTGQELTPGIRELVFEFTKTGVHQGTGRHYYDDLLVGEGESPRTTPNVIGASNDGLCCGFDVETEVSPMYAAPFRFTGELDHVVVTVGNDGNRDFGAEVAAAIVEQ